MLEVDIKDGSDCGSYHEWMNESVIDDRLLSSKIFSFSPWTCFLSQIIIKYVVNKGKSDDEISSFSSNVS